MALVRIQLVPCEVLTRFVQPIMRKIEEVDALLAFMNASAPQSVLGMVRRQVLSTYASGRSAWGPSVERFDAVDCGKPLAPPPSHAHADKHVEGWNAFAQSREGDRHIAGEDGSLTAYVNDVKCNPPNSRDPVSGMFGCTFCGSRSVWLRRCGGCRETR